jgi:hypothetical protein
MESLMRIILLIALETVSSVFLTGLGARLPRRNLSLRSVPKISTRRPRRWLSAPSAVP